MGDGVCNRLAFVIQDSPDERHQANAELSVSVLEPQGYETFVASTGEVPEADHYVIPTRENIRQQIREIKRRIDDDDELLIYFTGHGTREGVCLGEDCDTQDIFRQLDEIPYGQRIIIMAQSFSGNWSNIFTNDEKTRFISGGSEGEIADSQFSSLFWAKDVQDFNGDGEVGWDDRFSNAVNGMLRAGTYAFPRFFADGCAPSPQFARSDFADYLVENPSASSTSTTDWLMQQVRCRGESVGNGFTLVQQLFVGNPDQTPEDRMQLLAGRLTSPDAEVRLGVLRSLDFIIGRGINFELIEEIDLAQIAQAIVPLFDDANFDVRSAAFVTYHVIAEKSGSISELEQMATLSAHFGVYNEEVGRNAELMLELVGRNGMLLQYGSEDVREMRRIALVAVRQNGRAIQYAPAFWNDKEMWLEALRFNPAVEYLLYVFAPGELTDDGTFMRQARRAMYEGILPGENPDPPLDAGRERDFGRVLPPLPSPELDAEQEEDFWQALPPPELRGDADAMLEAARINKYVLTCAYEELWHNRNFVLEAVKIWAAAFAYAPDFWGDREIAREAVRGDRRLIQFISADLENDEEFMQQLQELTSEIE